MKTLTASPPFFTALALVLVATPAHAQQDDTAVSVGVADSAKAGSLPPLTSELAKKAAKAISKQDWANARSAYTEMLESQPENPLTLANLGVVEFQAGELEKAKTHLEKAVYIQPSLASCWRTLGLIHYQQDELALALSTLARSLHEDGSNAEAHNYLAAVTKALGWTRAAELELQKAIDLKPAYAEAHFNLAVIYLERETPALELGRRHYTLAKKLGAAPDKLVEKQLSDTE